MPATLTSAMLNDLNTGNSVLKLIPYVAGTGCNLDATGGVDFSAADEIFTLENSFQISKDKPSFNSIKIDQKHKVIESGVTAGDNYTMQGNIPSIAVALLSFGFEQGSASAAKAKISATESYDGSKAYKLGSLEKEYTVLAISQSGNTAILFARVKFIFSEPEHDDNTTPTYVHFDAVVLPNEHASGDFAPLPTHTVSSQA